MADPDIRVQTNFRTSLKRKRFERALGPNGLVCLIDLWLWVREHRPAGDLEGFSALDVEDAAGWDGEAGAFARALVEHRWIDETEGGFKIHNWEKRQPWSYGSERRSEIARENAMKRYNKRRGAETSQSTSPADGMQPASDPHANGTAPTPTPSLRGRGESGPPTRLGAEPSSGLQGGNGPHHFAGTVKCEDCPETTGIRFVTSASRGGLHLCPACVGKASKA